MTVTALLDNDLSGITDISTTVQLTTSYVLPVSDAIAHTLDLDAPSVTIDTNPGNAVGLGTQTFTGSADDGIGAGVATVETSTDGSAWTPATGTQVWSAEIDVSATRAPDADWLLYVRAADYHSQTSPVEIITFSPDTVAPIITPTVLALVGAQSLALIDGATRDPAPDDARVRQVEIQLDDDTAAWQPATLYAADGSGEQDWLYAWSLPYEDGVTHSLRFRATDYGDNVVTTTWHSTVVDTVPPVITVTQYFSQVTGLGDLAALSGSVTDGSGVSSVTVLVYPQVGASTQAALTLTGDQWSFTADTPGEYTLFVEAEDENGNSVVVGSYYVRVVTPLCDLSLDTPYVWDNLTLSLGALGDLDCIAVAENQANHPDAIPGLETGRFWIIEGVNSGGSLAMAFSATLTATLTFAPDADDELCRYTGSGQTWDCAASGYDVAGQTITRQDVTEFSEWAGGRAAYELTLVLDGTGSGSVVSDPPGVDCSATCSQTFAYATLVTLTATADSGSSFGGWSGGVVGTSNPVSITMTGDVSVTASFEQSGYDVYLPLVVRNL
ncbi:MAG: hypothetical protein GY833_18575 [Aestuariibacter sp.]|nr:hypothetical protein [Aestuariibacter sp.]